jgi:hypothetical protein
MEQGHLLYAHAARIHHGQDSASGLERALHDSRLGYSFRIGHELDAIVSPLDSTGRQFLNTSGEYPHNEPKVRNIRRGRKKAE